MLSYSASRFILDVKEEIRPIVPLNIIKGIYKVTPDLPLGLSINNDGIISGIPQKITPLTEYFIIVETNEGLRYTTTIQLEIKADEPLKCHYPITELIKSPTKTYEINCECNKNVTDYIFKLTPDTTTIKCDSDTGKITVYTNSSGIPTDVNIIAKTSTDESFEMNLKFRNEKVLNVPGVHFNYTNYPGSRCHKPLPPARKSFEDIGYVNGWHGYKTMDEFRTIFTIVRDLEFKMNFTWNMTIEEEGDYKFYLSLYSSAVFYIDDKEIINLDEICLYDNITTKEQSIHLTKGDYSMKLNTDNYIISDFNDYSYMTLYYSKPNEDEQLSLPAHVIDETFSPVEGLHTDQDSYEVVTNAYLMISLHTKKGYKTSCSCLETLPEGLFIDYYNRFIEGFPKYPQEKRIYHFTCRNEHSVTNVIEISITVKGELKPGIGAYYFKTERFPQNCGVFYTADDSQSKVYMQRYENRIEHEMDPKTGRFKDLPVNFISEFYAYYKGYIKFDYEGMYKIQLTHTDAAMFEIPGVCILVYGKCGPQQSNFQYCRILPGSYPIVISYMDNIREPIFNVTLALDDKELSPTFYHVVYENDPKVEYKCPQMIYTVREEILKNEILNPVEFEIEQVTITPPLPEGLSIDPKTGEITGTPQTESLLTEYEIRIEGRDSNKVEIAKIRIGVESITVPSGFYYYDLIHNVEIEPRSDYPRGKEVKLEIRNRVGVVDKYYMIESVPAGFNYSNANGQLIIFGKSEKVKTLDFFYKAYSGNYAKMEEFALFFEYEKNVPLECHYPYSRLFRYPKGDASYGCKCNKKVDSFSILNITSIINTNNPDPSQFSVDSDSGEFTIKATTDYNQVFLDLLAHIDANTDAEGNNQEAEDFIMHMTLDGNGDFVNKGMKYNFTSFQKHNCHSPWNNPINNHTGITNGVKFHGYRDENEFMNLFPLVESAPYTFYMNWNLTIKEKSDYTFYVDFYDTVELYIDDVKVIDGFQVCSKVINHFNNSINLDVGSHKVLLFVETYSDSVNHNYLFIQYGKNGEERKDIELEFWDDTFNPALELSTAKSNYTFGINQMIEDIVFMVESGNTLSCECKEKLPNGLKFGKRASRVLIEGKTMELQESKPYHISCQNTHSITNEITIYIQITDNYRPGLYVSYLKSKNGFDEECKTYYEPGNDNSVLYVRRHEMKMKHVALIDGRFEDLPYIFNGEYSMVMNGYIAFQNGGKYTITVTHSDSVYISIGNVITIDESKCQNITMNVYENVELEDVIYPFTLKYTNNYFDPYVDLEFTLDNNNKHNNNNRASNYYYFYVPEGEVEYNYTDATYYFNETIVPNRLIGVLRNIKNITTYPNLPDGLKLNIENGEITGIPIVEQFDRQLYLITIETDERIYYCQITIEIVNLVLPDSFYIHNLITDKDIEDEIPTFKQAEKLDIEIYNRIGYVKEYVLLKNLTKGLKVDTSNSHLRITGNPDSTTKSDKIWFKAKNGNEVVKHESLVLFEPICLGKEVNHLFTYISDYNESSIRLRLSAVDGSSQSELLFTTVLNTTSICLVEGDYLFHIDSQPHDFTLNLTVNGKILFMKKFKQYQTVHEVFTTFNHPPEITYNDDEVLYLYPYQNFTLYPNVTGYIYGFREPKGLTPTMNYDMETGKLWGYLTDISAKTYYFGIYGFIGTPSLYSFRIVVNANQESLACVRKGRISLTFFYHIEDEEIKKFMSLSISDSKKKEIYHATAYSYPKHETYYENVCVGDDDYVIHLYDTNPKLEGWKNNHIILEVNNLVYGEYSVKGNEHLRDIPLHLHPFLHSKIEWSYSYHYLEDYYKFNTKDDWSVSLFDNIPKTTTNTTYIRYYFDVNKDLPFVSTLISLNYLSGIIVYINEKQVFKDNMDYKEYDENTPASDYNDLITNVKFIIPLDSITTEKVLIAVELHKHESEMKYPHFNLTVDLLDDHDGCTNLNVYNGKVIQYYPDEKKTLYHTNVTNIFANNDKYWSTELPEGFGSGNDNDIEVEYSFGEYNYFCPNALYIESYAEDDDENYTVNGIPKSMKIQGRNSPTSSNTTLIDVKDIGLTEKKSSKYIKFFGNSNGFNLIRFNISSVNKVSGDETDQMNINKLRLLSCRINDCEAVGNLPKTQAGEVVKIQCKSPSETYKVFECMNGVNPKWKEIENYCEEEPIILNKINRIKLIQYEYTSTSIGDISGIDLKYSIKPNLPKGLSLIDGFIVGGCDELMKDTEYEIEIKNDFGKKSINLTVSVEESYYPIVNMNDNKITLTSGMIYNEEKIFNVIGKELIYSVYPDLPKGIELNQNGLLSGLLKEEIENKEYLLTVKNENRTIYYVFYLNSYLPDSPYILSLLKSVSLHYGTDYKNLVFYDIYGKNLKYKLESELPKNLLLNPENGVISGKIQYLQSRSEKIVIRAETDKNYTDVIIDMDISHPIVPIVVSCSREIKIELGKEVSISTGVVLGQNLYYSMNNLPIGLEIDHYDGNIKGVSFDSSQMSRNSIVNVGNSHGSIQYEVKLTLTYPKVPIITEVRVNNTFNPSTVIEPFYLIRALGNNVEYRIKPNLPKGLHFLESSGILYGKSLGISKNVNYRITVVSDDEYITKDVVIKVDSIYCNADGEWPMTLVGDFAEIPCQTAGYMRRECKEINGVGVWGEIENYCHNKSNANMILIVILSSVLGLVVVVGVVCIARFMMIKRKNNENKEQQQQPLL